VHYQGSGRAKNVVAAINDSDPCAMCVRLQRKTETGRASTYDEDIRRLIVH
jgi:hypothetical protein